MRFMLLMIPAVYQKPTDPDFMPPADMVAKMLKFNAELTQAGVLVTLDGLHPPEKGARVRFTGGKPHATEGPFAGTNDVIGGYWIIRAKSKAEAVAWATRCPALPGDMIEVRQMRELEDFPPEIQKLVK